MAAKIWASKLEVGGGGGFRYVPLSRKRKNIAAGKSNTPSPLPSKQEGMGQLKGRDIAPG